MSQIKITIGMRVDCPPAWNKMMDLLDKPENIDEYEFITHESIRRELKKVGARWSAQTETMIFPNEKSYALWLMRFS